jgi:hypothetical protein
MLTTRVASLCQEASRRFTAPWTDEVRAVEAALTEPLRVAVAGRVNSGKSTLVNAILGQVVAPTAEGESTSVVTWFRYGVPSRVEVVLRDGSSRELPLARNRIPERLPASPASIERLDVWLSNEHLRTMTVIDTPGLGSLDPARRYATEQFLGIVADSRSAVAGAEAIVFVLNDSVKLDEQEAIRAFRDVSAGIGNTATNAIGVLTKADKVGGQRDPWTVACELAAGHAESLRGELATVIPVMGLLAETSGTGGFREADARTLAALAQLGPDQRKRILRSPVRFLGEDGPVDVEDRRRLLRRLDLYGIRRALDAIDEGVTGAAALRRWLEGLSGLRPLREALVATFGQRADALKADWSLSSLEGIAYRMQHDRAGGAWLRDRIEELRLDPEFHELQEMEASRSVASGRVALPEDLRGELTRLFTRRSPGDRLGTPGASPGELQDAALEGVGRWRSFANRASDPAVTHVASIVAVSYELLWAQVAEPERKGAYR